MKGSEDIIAVDELTYSIGGAKIINGVSFSGERDRFVSIIGPSGCGKSTLLRIMAGLIRPDSGRVLYKGNEITEPISEISFVFQDFGLLPWLTNMENVKLGLSATGMNDGQKTKRAKELLAQFKLGAFEDSYPNTLSGGMKQRVGVARAVAARPKVLLMDEPFSSLDELTANRLRREIVSLLRGGRIRLDSIVMVTHNVEEAVELSDKIVILSDKPSVVKETRTIDLKYPRDRHSKRFFNLVDYVDGMLKG